MVRCVAGDGRALAVYLTQRRPEPAWFGRVVQIMTGSVLSPAAWAGWLEVARQAASMLAESGDLVVNGTLSSTGRQVQVDFDVPLRTRFELADDPLGFARLRDSLVGARWTELDRAPLTELGLDFYRADVEPARRRAVQALGGAGVGAGDSLLVSQLALLDVVNRSHARDGSAALFGSGAGAGVAGAVQAPGAGFDLFDPDQHRGVDLFGLALQRHVPAVMALAAAQAAGRDLVKASLPAAAAAIVFQAVQTLNAFTPPAPLPPWWISEQMDEVWPGGFGAAVRLFRRGGVWHVWVGLEPDGR